MSLRIVEAVAAATDTDPIDLTPPLYDVVDTDALDRLVEGEAFRHVEFEYDGLAVRVNAHGRIDVDGRRVESGGS